ncbi:hypothetical protein Hypma_009836 [Hypsizygus marmoreus]|uniref:Uncharacterized protein n=1 Tax=Hypsizygus marmoreus TaxID=39966 RepID=A0A369JMG7_HYPMA|nr:hypothetical protein Hypma_009836 [Hypsizygus marmoreus]
MPNDMPFLKKISGKLSTRLPKKPHTWFKRMNPNDKAALESFSSRASSLRHILRTNNPPSEHEFSVIRYLLQDVQEYVAVHDLHSEYRAYRPFHDLKLACQSALSSLRRLPAEIISHIFSQVVQDLFYFSDEGWMSLNTTKEPWTLAQISRSWRAVALGHQEIWSYVKIDIKVLKMKRAPEPSLAALQCCLRRSGTHALSIYFKDSYPPVTPRVKELLCALVPHSRQWKVVRFSISFEDLELLMPVRGHLPSLHSLALLVYGFTTSGDVNIFEIAPQLREVSLEMYAPYTQLLLPWPQLTTIFGWRARDMSFLRQATSLEGCSLTFYRSDTPSVLVPPIQMPLLRRLQLELECHLAGLTAPSLEDLNIHGIYMSPTLSLQHVTAFVRRSSCALRSLLFRHITIEGEFDIMPLLDSVPSLAFLQVKYGQVGWNKLFRVLTITETRRLVPNLKAIRFIFGFQLHTPPYLDPSIHPSLLLDMIESRFYPDRTSGLESVALLEWKESLPELCVGRLAKLEEQGLKVEDDARLGVEEDLPSVVDWAWDDVMD